MLSLDTNNTRGSLNVLVFARRIILYRCGNALLHYIRVSVGIRVELGDVDYVGKYYNLYKHLSIYVQMLFFFYIIYLNGMTGKIWFYAYDKNIG